MIPALLVAFLLWLVAPAQAASCTVGTDCYGDCVRGPDGGGGYKNGACLAKGVPVDTLLLLVEDFEAPTLINNTGVGNGAPYYGPWYDGTGWSGCARGGNSYWTRTYDSGGGTGSWTLNTPATPTLGCTCTYGPVQTCFRASWDATNRWNGNTDADTGSGGAVMGIFQDADFSAEVGTITKPTGRAGGGSGAFDGIASLAFRVPTATQTSILGGKSFGGTYRTFGITQAVAYPNNSTASGVWGAPWKHNEWHVAGSGGGGDGLFLFWNGNGRSAQTPFDSMFTFNAGDSSGTCASKLAAATVTAGNVVCHGADFFWAASSSNYVQGADWPDGTWGCVEGYYQNIGTSNSTIQVWFTGPAGVRKKLVDVTGMDMTGQSAKDGYDQFLWNGFANTNQGGGPTPTNQTTFRYEDNVHIRAGAPVSCAQIGYAAASSTATTQIGGGWTIKPGWSF